jgi:cephalosporin hydroxylase
VTSDFASYWQRRVRQSVDNLTYKGHSICKLPEDLALYHEVIWETKPDTIIELGTGDDCGSAMWFADQLRMHWVGPKVITVDTKDIQVDDPSILKLTGDILSPEVFRTITENMGQRVMVVEDSAHTYGTTLFALRTFGPLVTSGCYMVVEDTIVEDEEHCPPDWYDPGTVGRAIDEFMEEEGADWEREAKDKFIVTMHDKGWLRRR